MAPLSYGLKFSAATVIVFSFLGWYNPGMAAQAVPVITAFTGETAIYRYANQFSGISYGFQCKDSASPICLQNRRSESIEAPGQHKAKNPNIRLPDTIYIAPAHFLRSVTRQQ